MAENKKEIEINTDCYSSDDWILKMFEGYFDPCPLNNNPEIDALKIDWKDKTFVNPPYSHPLPFVRKAIEESRKGKLIVMLLKMDTSTNWFKELKEANAEFLWINGRLSTATHWSKAFRREIDMTNKTICNECLNGICINGVHNHWRPNKTLSDEITKSWGNDEIKWLHQDNVKKHLQKFGEELKSEIDLFFKDNVPTKGESYLDNEMFILLTESKLKNLKQRIDAQMQKHFGNKLLK